jgi:multicomponent Na+:H+ antiporter subunit E
MNGTACQVCAKFAQVFRFLYDRGAMWQRAFQYAQIAVLLGITWVVFNERLDTMTLLSGMAVGGFAIIVTNKLVLKESYRRRYHLHFWKAALYLLRLFYEIYAAGFEAVYRMFTGRINVGVVDITTELTDDFSVCLLANSITLTPGTVTLDREGQNLKVIWLTVKTRDPVLAGEEIKGLFERLLREVVR